MKTLKILVLLFIATLSFSAQFEIVKDVAERPGDLSVQQYPVKDVNGDWCALLKVFTDIKDLQFKGTGYEKHDYRDGTYYVYMFKDSKNLTFIKDSYTTKPHNFPISLKSNVVYGIEIKGMGEEKKIEDIAITVQTDPSGAIVYLDGVQKGASEQVMTSVGAHELKLEKEGCETKIVKIEVSAGNTLFKHTLEKVKQVGIVISSEPSGAMVFIEGIKFSETPMSDFYKSGSYKIKLVKEGYLNLEQTIDIKSPKYENKFTLTKNVGGIKVTTAPEKGLDIYIDGVKSSNKSDYTISDLKPGKYRIKAQSQYYETEEKEVEVTVGKLNEIQLKAEAIFGDLHLTTIPEKGLDIYIDGIKQENKSDFTFKNYKPGKYKIKAQSQFYETEEKFIEVTRGKLTEIELKTKENFGTLTINTNPKAEVILNGKKITQLKDIRLEPQKCNIEIKMKKASNIKESLILQKHDKKELDLYPKIATGTVQIAVYPDDAEITLSEVGGETFTGKGLVLFEEVPIGVYSLSIKTNGYKTYKKEVKVEEGKTVKDTGIKLEAGTDIQADLKTKSGVELISVLGGTFHMGSNDDESDEKSVHSVTVGDFYIGKTEVTQAQWKTVMGNNPSYFKGDNNPVEKISWNDAVEFCKKLSQKEGVTYRLPTEAEWEYAAKGGNQSMGYEYSGSNNVGEVAEYEGNNNKSTKPVAGKKPNELGIYDMTGNVWEWCSDWYDSNYYKNSPSSNPTGPSSGIYRALRGGSWYISATHCRVADRNCCFPDDSSRNFGFRVVRLP